ncbi:hypothetical protein Pfo_006641 [Paulownia fortunei]|nr:hypothetical protein Pfo_006641 [Paulownia fortunei]
MASNSAAAAQPQNSPLPSQPQNPPQANQAKKMEGLSKGMLDRVEEEYSSILSSTANSSVASSASTSTSKRIECPEFSSFSTRQLIVEQVRAETEQWSQMQEMLGQVRGEMEELQASRDFWENRAYNSDYEIQSLRHAVEEWKEKALGYENKANNLQLELSVLKQKIQKSKIDLNPGQTREPIAIPDLPPVPLGKQLEKEKLVLSFRLKKNCHIEEEGYKFENALEELNIEEENKERTPNKNLPPLSLGKQLAKEKRMLLRRLKENHHPSEKGSKQELSADARRKPYTNSIGAGAPKRSPLRDIGNSSPLARQNSRAAFAFHCPESYGTRDSFRK